MGERVELADKNVSALAVENLDFSYPDEVGGVGPAVLRKVTCTVEEGAFALLTGDTGSGKTTLLRLAKPEIAPTGHRQGSVRVFGHETSGLTVAQSAQLVGYVFQNPDNQIVCDTVWHELAFGLENLGMDQTEMRRRLSEVCVFLGIEPLLRCRCAELSSGQQQIVALAAVLVMRPRLLLLDEPTAMLDPVAEQEFLALLFRANRELGLTVVVATHHPAPMVRYATCGLRMADGGVRPVALGELEAVRPLACTPPTPVAGARELLKLEDVWKRYQRDGRWVLRGCDLGLAAGEVRALVGGNGSGKSTLLQVAAGMLGVRRGKVRRSTRRLALLPASPKALLGCETVRDELLEWHARSGYGTDEVDAALARLGLTERAAAHPYDLSGGQQQLLALEKLLLTQPELLLLDEPTKGLDHASRQLVAQRVCRFAAEDGAVLLATHDLPFVQAVAHTVSLLFDGQASAAEPTEAFFAASWMWRP